METNTIVPPPELQSPRRMSNIKQKRKHGTHSRCVFALSFVLASLLIVFISSAAKTKFRDVVVNHALVQEDCVPDEWNCTTGWQPVVTYSDKAIKHFEKAELRNPLPLLTSNPYDNDTLVEELDKIAKDQLEKQISIIQGKLENPYTPDPTQPFDGYIGTVCVVEFHDEKRLDYSIETLHTDKLFELIETTDRDLHVTHRGACGQCSTLQDLAVYLSIPDLSSPIQRCTKQLLASPTELQSCFQETVPFSDGCALIWVYNAMYTRKSCITTCLFKVLLGEENNPSPQNSCTLNDCILCDEIKSGPIFKKYAGRTRRASGLISAINRPYNSIFRLHHCYYDYDSELIDDGENKSLQPSVCKEVEENSVCDFKPPRGKGTRNILTRRFTLFISFVGTSVCIYFLFRCCFSIKRSPCCRGSKEPGMEASVGNYEASREAKDSFHSFFEMETSSQV